MTKKSILVIDDDLNICREIKQALQSETTDVQYALSVDEALKMFLKHPFCLVIMDVLLSEIDGIQLLKILRQTKTVPILVLSAKAETSQRADLLKAGASAYMDKPYDLEECLAQAQSLMYLYTSANTPVCRCYTLAFGMNLIIDPSHWRATLMGEPLDLTPKEFALLYYLASHEGLVLTRKQIYEYVWYSDSNINLEGTIKSHVSSLRQKLNPGGKKYIECVRGIGYRFSSGGKETGADRKRNG